MEKTTSDPVLVSEESGDSHPPSAAYNMGEISSRCNPDGSSFADPELSVRLLPVGSYSLPATAERADQVSEAATADIESEMFDTSTNTDHFGRELDAVQGKQLRRGRLKNNSEIPVFDEESDAAYEALLRKLEDERKEILNQTDSRILAAILVLRRERDENLQRARDERDYRLSEARNRIRSEIQRANADFYSAKAALRRHILCRSHSLHDMVKVASGKEPQILFTREKTSVHDLEKAGLMNIVLTPDEIKGDIWHMLRGSDEASEVPLASKHASDDTGENRSKVSGTLDKDAITGIASSETATESSIGSVSE